MKRLNVLVQTRADFYFKAHQINEPSERTDSPNESDFILLHFGECVFNNTTSVRVAIELFSLISLANIKVYMNKETRIELKYMTPAVLFAFLT